MTASAGIEDAATRALYMDLVLLSLNAATRSALEAVMSIKNYEYQSEFARTYFQQGLEQGRVEGRVEGRLEGELRPLVRQFERLLARGLSDAERARLTERVRAQGAERVGDLVLDLSAQDLATWLAATNGH
ncbi:hypothetical protein [Polyangium sorediatum]|uniref:DUF4351 domain-containing protein n=1 Tax=Polyangium sorediatum TaxID=889274 RepID=A0ABT6P9Q5_9BACT|nr:hypothetical protein [Polyangium sorediatum]MDI1437268.1 hypothetical protein [Polyangium sorediatum]